MRVKAKNEMIFKEYFDYIKTEIVFIRRKLANMTSRFVELTCSDKHME